MGKTLADLRIKARFVGGPKHNEVVETDGWPAITVVEPTPFKVMLDAPLDVFEDTRKISHYRLMRFVSEGGARWMQYIHESLIVKNEPDHRTYAPPEPLFIGPQLADYWFTMQRRSLERLECKWRCRL
jgi:hypothetical protein